SAAWLLRRQRLLQSVQQLEQFSQRPLAAAHRWAAARDRREQAEADLRRLDGLHPGRELGYAVVQHGAAVCAFGQSPRRALEPGRLHDDERRLAIRMIALTRRSALRLLALGGTAAL